MKVQPGRAGATVAAFLVLSMLGPHAEANAGDLDPSFGGDGKVTTTFSPSSFETGGGVVIQSDGKIVVAGTVDAHGNGKGDFALARYNSGGSLDATFGQGGLVRTDFGRGSESASAVALQVDGKIVAAGTRNDLAGTVDFALARYNSDGSLDVTFSQDGKQTTDFGGRLDIGYAVAVQGDGRVVLAGSSQGSPTWDMAVARYRADGSLDRGFSGDGRQLIDFSGGFEEAFGIVVQSDGRIVLAGYTDVGNGDFALARLTRKGSLDASFSGDGLQTTDLGNVDRAQSIALQMDGKIVVAGFSESVQADFALARYDGSGELDSTFGGGGLVLTDFGDYDVGYALAIQSNGMLIVAGYSGANTTDFALARYESSGELDPTFGTGGKIVTDFAGESDIAEGVAIQADGKIVAAGETGLQSDLAAARYLP